MSQDAPARPSTPLLLMGGALITLTAWTWGGVVLWAQWAVLSLGLLCLAHELLADVSERGLAGPRARRALLLSAGAAFLVAGALCWHEHGFLVQQREATLQLLPAADLAPLAPIDWAATGLLAGWVTFVAGLVAVGLVTASAARRRLFGLGVFWVGAALFAWMACQACNTWGVVVQRDLFWYVSPREHLAWLPSGLEAPFNSTEEPGGMNAWRQLLILCGPWAFFCALRISQLGRRHYGALAMVAILNAIGIAVAGHVSQSLKLRAFLGFHAHDARHVIFGPFVYRNHAGCYLYLAGALALALMFQFADRRGCRADRGGPHLIAGFAALLLLLAAASTLSLGATLAALILAVMVAVAYLVDRRLRANVSPVPVVVMAVLFGAVLWSAFSSEMARGWRRTMEAKKIQLVVDGEDSRAALRTVCWTMLEAADLGRLVSGYGAGSFRWVSPPFMAKQPEFLSRKGVLIRRASYAHNDWAQAVLEWGLMGLMLAACALRGLFRTLAGLAAHPSAAHCMLAAGMAVFALHAFFDFLLFQPLLILLALAAAWAGCLARHANGARQPARASAIPAQ